MLKGMAILAFVVVFAISAVKLVPAQQKTPTNEQERQGDQLSTTVNETNNCVSAQQKEDSADGVQWWHKFVTWPESWTAWAIIVTLGAFIWQACLMRGHAKHLRSLAEHIVASERAWIIAVLPAPIRSTSKAATFKIATRAENRGRTPAFVTETACAAIVLPKSDSLPKTPPDYPDVTKYDGLGVPLAPEGGFGGELVGVFTDEAGVLKGDFVLWVLGYAKYRDVFLKEIRETRYCFQWEPFADGYEHSQFVVGGPEGYNRAT
jgi:hypothetical protein